MSLALQLAGQIWFASLRMEDIDRSYSDAVRRLDRFTVADATDCTFAEACSDAAATEVERCSSLSAVDVSDLAALSRSSAAC